MSKRKSGQADEPQSLRFQAGQENLDEEAAEDMFDEAVNALAQDLSRMPPEPRRQAVMFMAGQLLGAAVDGDPIQIVGMLEIMKSDIILSNFDDDDPFAPDENAPDSEDPDAE